MTPTGRAGPSSPEVQSLHPVHPMRRRARTAEALLEDTADLLRRLDYANLESRVAAQFQIEAIMDLLTPLANPASTSPILAVSSNASH